MRLWRTLLHQLGKSWFIGPSREARAGLPSRKPNECKTKSRVYRARERSLSGTIEGRGTRRRYIQTLNGQLVTFRQYLEGIMAEEEKREHTRKNTRDQALLDRWAKMWRATKGNGNGSHKNGQG